MTDFDYGLAKAAIRITSDRSERVWLWFWPQMTAIRDRMIAAAKQDMWEARRESREHVFCGERRGKQCDLTIDQLRTWKGLVRVQFGLSETAAAVLAWARESGIVLVDDREQPPVSSPVSSKAARKDCERSAVLRREGAVPPAPVMPQASPVPASPSRQPKPPTGSTLLRTELMAPRITDPL